jgi:hypothetical protein
MEHSMYSIASYNLSSQASTKHSTYFVGWSVEIL